MKSNWHARLALVILMVAGFLVSLAMVAPAKADPMKTLKLACIQPFSGPFGFYGHANRAHVEVYVELLNEDGGVKIGKDTYKIEVFFIDDAGDPKKGPVAAQEAINKNCLANFGCYSLIAPIVNVLTPAKIILVGQMQQGIDLKKHTYFIGANDEIRNPVHGIYAALEMWPQTKKIGSLWYDWQKKQAEAITEEMKKPGTPITKKGIEIYSEYQVYGDNEFTPALTKFGKAGVDMIESGVGPGDFALAAKQANQLGLKFKFFNAGCTTGVNKFVDMAGYDNAQGISFNWPCPWELKKSKPSPEMLKMALRIRDRFLKKHGTPMEFISPFEFGTNQLRILLDFFEQAGTLDPDKVMKKVRGGTVRDFQGIWTMGGEKTWGAPVIKGNACLNSVIKGRVEVYGAEFPMLTLP